ncbi:hypothetical protein ECG_08778 [Echinococcus granulosus]|uniref:Uncharacterized protein n=1 Tax=Echinococcus granulosus TaxID=6210 RepID=U6JP69_ECHGR|nr:hypothetical protein EGR_09112 [Echinococcus granulosus]EUB56032.1 hypothetical protein EGR_09112 [Echinococcus granulosus]KAH9278288.1 hypothetical protein ECG_08778 [Echinococcus granulosus]CDS23644.1 hypothetical protein EgrG_000922900 [Echinococcus granulosus]
MEALLGLGGVGGVGGVAGGCGCQCDHCKCRQPDETPCPSCRPMISATKPAGASAASTAGVQTSKSSDMAAAVDLLNVALKKIRRRGSLAGTRNENFFHPGEVLWGNGTPAGRMGHGHGFTGGSNPSLF